MSSLHHRRARHPSAAAPGLASALLLLASGPVNVAAAQSEASERRQTLVELRDVNADAKRNADELRSQMEQLQAEEIDRGVLMTLDDAVFTTNNAILSDSGHRRLKALADFLQQHPQRSVEIYGYAGAGDFRYDQALSQHRADAVKAYLIRKDVAPSRLTARSSGEAQQDHEDSASALRRVEVIIEDPLTSVPQSHVTGPGTVHP